MQYLCRIYIPQKDKVNIIKIDNLFYAQNKIKKDVEKVAQ